jgi:PhzF family phenazine biosynthesis protein
MQRRRFTEIDVFTDNAFFGNPLAVVVDANGVGSAAMQRFANWTNLSETAFLLPPTKADADYRVRIFTPTLELPFAGHPTLGSCHAWLAHGGVPRSRDVIVQECDAGLIRIRRSADRLSFAAPALRRSGPVDAPTVAKVARILGIDVDDIVDSQWVDNGPGWVAVMLRDADAVLALRPGFVEDLDIGVVGMHTPGSAATYEVRAFFAKDGATVEDPVTGSLNASIAQWMLSSGRVVAPYIASQGGALGRAGRVHVDADAASGDVWVGGDCVTCVTGIVEL